MQEIQRREGVVREATDERHEEEEEQRQADDEVEELERNIEEEQAQIDRLAEEIRLERLRAESHLSEVQPSLIEENPEAVDTDDDEFDSDEEGSLAQLPIDFFPDLQAVEQFPEPYDSEGEEIDVSGGPLFEAGLAANRELAAEPFDLTVHEGEGPAVYIHPHQDAYLETSEVPIPIVEGNYLPEQPLLLQPELSYDLPPVGLQFADDDEDL